MALTSAIISFGSIVTMTSVTITSKKSWQITLYFMVIIHFGQTIKFKIIYNNIPHTPSNVGVVARKTFSFTPDEAMSVGLAKACARRIKSILFIEKSNALNNIKTE